MEVSMSLGNTRHVVTLEWLDAMYRIAMTARWNLRRNTTAKQGEGSRQPRRLGKRIAELTNFLEKPYNLDKLQL